MKKEESKIKSKDKVQKVYDTNPQMREALAHAKKSKVISYRERSRREV